VRLLRLFVDVGGNLEGQSGHYSEVDLRGADLFAALRLNNAELDVGLPRLERSHIHSQVVRVREPDDLVGVLLPPVLEGTLREGQQLPLVVQLGQQSNLRALVDSALGADAAQDLHRAYRHHLHLEFGLANDSVPGDYLENKSVNALLYSLDLEESRPQFLYLERPAACVLYHHLHGGGEFRASDESHRADAGKTQHDVGVGAHRERFKDVDVAVVFGGDGAPPTVDSGAQVVESLRLRLEVELAVLAPFVLEVGLELRIGVNQVYAHELVLLFGEGHSVLIVDYHLHRVGPSHLHVLLPHLQPHLFRHIRPVVDSQRNVVQQLAVLYFDLGPARALGLDD
jgi:hypothetical protein